MSAVFGAWAAVPLPGPNIVFDGDSLWERNGNFQAAPNRISDYIKARHPEATVVNFGVGGQRWDQMNSDAVSQVDSRFSPGSPNNVLHCGSGVNEWEQGWTPTNAYASAVNYLKARKAAGWKLVVNTIPNCYFLGRDPNYWLQYNALIRSDPAGIGYVICDVGADPAFTNYTDSTHRLDAAQEPCRPCRVHYKDAAIVRWTGLSEVAIEAAFAVTLAIRRANGQLKLSWPVSWNAYTLQHASNPSDQNGWSTSDAPVSVVGSNHEAFIPIEGTQKFFRLIP